MKKHLISILCLLFTFLAVSAQDVMIINKTDGTKTCVPVTKIQNVTFSDSEDNSIVISDKSLTSTNSFIVEYTVSTTQTVDQVGISYGPTESANTYKVIGKLENNVGTISVTNLDFERTYYIKAYAMINGTTYESEITTITTPDQYPVAPEIVDLGLSIKWASCNMGGVVDTNTGCFLPWGYTNPPSDFEYSSSTYPKQTISVSCISGTQYDIAKAKWGGDWRLPTLEEFQELWDNTTHEQVTDMNEDGYYLMKLTSKKNGKSIYLAKGGFMQDGKQYSPNVVGFYWTGDIKSENNGWASSFGIQSPTNGYETAGAKYYGGLIRPVYGAVPGSDPSGKEYEYVDLGIVSLWSPVNYGATTETEVGSYIAWGEQSTKSSYTADGYQYYNNGDYIDISTLSAKSAILQNNKLDVVANNWGGKWHMPTYSQVYDLINNCVWTWTTIDGVSGYKVSGKLGTAYANNYIFLPVTGNKSNSSTLDRDQGYYWSGEQYNGEIQWGYSLNFDSTAKSIPGVMKYKGCVIRPCRDR